MLIGSVTLQARCHFKGIVFDKQTSEPLIGVAVVQDGTVNGTESDADGFFSLNINDDSAFVTISFVGYKSVRVSLKGNASGKISITDIATGDILKVTEDGVIIQLEVDADFLADAVVVAKRSGESITALRNERINSSFAVENMGAKEFSLKGLSNVQESVVKLPGLSVAGAGQIIVRGLGDRYSTTTLNGLPIASPNPDNKLIPLDIFPSSTVESISVSKVYEASAYADYSGAHIDISTGAAGYKDQLNMSISTGGRFNTVFRESYRMVSPSIYVTNTLDPKAESLPHSDFKKYILSNSIFGKTPFTVQKRVALPDLNLSAGYSHIFNVCGKRLSMLASLSSKYSEQIVTDGFQKTFEASGSQKSMFNYNKYSQKSDIAALLNLEQEIGENDAITLTGFFARNADRALSVRNGIDYEDRTLFGENQTDHVYTMTTLQLTGDHILDKWKVDWGVSSSFTGSDEPDRRQMLFQEDEKGEWRFFTNNLETYRYFGKLGENEFAADVRASYSLDNHSTIKFGLSGKYKDRNFSTVRFLYDVSGITQTITPGVMTDIDPLVGYDAIAQGKLQMSRKMNARDRYTAFNSIGATFLEYERSFSDRFFLNAGIRFEMSRVRVDYNDDVENTYRILDGYDPFFALNLKYKFDGGHFLRASFSRTITRPSFVETAPFLYQESYGGAMLRGNSELRNAYNYNVDLRYEYFSPQNNNMFAITGYFKFLKDPIERIQRYSGGAPEHSFQNADKGVAAGVEAELKYEIIKGLAVDLNASYMFTNVTLPTGGVYTNSERELQGASPYLVNCDIIWSTQFKSERSLSLVLMYNLQGPRIHSVGLSGLGDVRQMPFHSLDFNCSFAFNTNLSLTLYLSNILDSRDSFKQDIPQTGEIVDVEGWRSGRGFSLGIKWIL